MNKQELKILIDEILMKMKLLSDELNDREERTLGGAIGVVDTSSVLFEIEEGVAFLINGNKEIYDDEN